MNSRKRLRLAVILFVVVFAFGVAGFKIFGGKDWSFLDSVYMTVITVATIGYGEVHDLAATRRPGSSRSSISSSAWGRSPSPSRPSRPSSSRGSSRTSWGDGRWKRDRPAEGPLHRLRKRRDGPDHHPRASSRRRRTFVVIEPSKERIDRLLAAGSVPLCPGRPGGGRSPDQGRDRPGQGHPPQPADRRGQPLRHGDRPEPQSRDPDRGQGDRCPLPREDAQGRGRLPSSRRRSSAACGCVSEMVRPAVVDLPGHDAPGPGTGPPGRRDRRPAGFAVGREDASASRGSGRGRGPSWSPSNGEGRTDFDFNPAGFGPAPGRRRPGLHRFAGKPRELGARAELGPRLPRSIDKPREVI